MEGLGRRLAAFDSVAAPRRVYTRALGQAWLVLAREQYAMNDRSGLVDEAFGRASALAATLESRNMMLSPQSREIAGSPPIRPDLWKLADSLKRTEALRCVAEDVARLELTLVRAGHEATICRPADPHPYALAATAQGARVRTLADECVLHVAVARAPVEAPLPETAPAPVPEAVRAALVRLSALGNVHFDLNAETISAASATVLDSVVSVMGSVPQVRATLIGHTDPRGSVAYNLALGHRRASAVRATTSPSGASKHGALPSAARARRHWSQSARAPASTRSTAGSRSSIRGRSTHSSRSAARRATSRSSGRGRRLQRAHGAPARQLR